MLIRTLDAGLTNQFDSIILEIQIPDTEFGLKRYRASKQEVINLRNEYENVDSSYIPILKYIMRNEAIFAITRFDEAIVLYQNQERSLMDTSYWDQYGTFLNYLQFDFLIEKTDSIKDDARVKIFKKFFGESTFYIPDRRPLDLVNFILEQDGQTPMIFELSDTSRYGYRPPWL